MLREKLADVLVISLSTDVDRKQHIKKHFNECGLTDYRFVQAVPADSALVYALYAKGRVKGFPECFRCFKVACECANNILIPQQVANWLSFKKIWEIVADAKGPVLVCEDDVYFYKNGLSLLDNVLDEILDISSPQLIRLGHSGLTTETDLSALTQLEISNDVVMSNVAHIITPSMARLLLTKFDYIDTTSDIWLHNWLAKYPGVKAHTVKPLVATDLSFNKAFAQFRSQIHPKGIDADDEERARQHIKRVDSVAEYSAWLAKLLGSSHASEKARQLSTFNQLIQSANPRLAGTQLEQVKAQNMPAFYSLVKSTLLPAQSDIFTAQEGEDALLKRLLKWHYNNPGYYVDVGAHHPTRFSNTYHYYLKGWRGINIDPIPGVMKLFDEQRPGDINLEMGVANQQGALTYTVFKEPAFNTFDPGSVAYAETRTEKVGEHQISVKPLSAVLQEYVSEEQHISFLSVDVEGFELPVLQSNDWQRYRPMFVIAEALSDDAQQQINDYLNSVSYIRVASTKNSYFFCDRAVWPDLA
tara:strand:+ start:255 stop:1841 length:1587 start_codon:yes stop_codon:yes gene_type:complete